MSLNAVRISNLAPFSQLERACSGKKSRPGLQITQPKFTRDRELCVFAQNSVMHADNRERGSPRPIHLGLDFDGTITEKDTMSAFGEYLYHLPKYQDETGFPPWSHFVEAYMKDFHEHEDRYRPQRADRTSIEEEVEWLKSLEYVERASLDRVKESGLSSSAKRLGEGDASKFVREADVCVRDGFRDLVKKIVSFNSPSSNPATWESRVSITSVNWSRAWVWLCFHACCGNDFRSEPEPDPTELFRASFSMGECIYSDIHVIHYSWSRIFGGLVSNISRRLVPARAL